MVAPTAAQLAQAYDEAKKACPQVELAKERFFGWLAERAEKTPLAELQLGELYLACACAQRDKVALALFEKDYLCKVDAALARLGGGAAQAEDLKQLLRQKLFVGDGGRPKIVEYSGRGSLSRWLRAVAVRSGIDAQRVEREVPTEDRLLAVLDLPGSHPELSHLKRTSREEFKHAFREAFAELPDREKSFVQQYYLDGVNLETLASLYRVAPSTVSRALAKARHELLTGARAALMRRMRIDADEADSLVRLIQSQLELSVRGLLRTKR